MAYQIRWPIDFVMLYRFARKKEGNGTLASRLFKLLMGATGRLGMGANSMRGESTP